MLGSYHLNLVNAYKKLKTENDELKRNNSEYDCELAITQEICTRLEESAQAVIEQNEQLRCELKHAEGLLQEQQDTIKARDRALRMARSELESLRKRGNSTFGGGC